MKTIALLQIVILISFGVCLGSTKSEAAQAELSYSFENDLEGWAVNGTDVSHGPGTIDWSITRSHEMAKDGNTSLKYMLINQNDAGKIWVEKPFSVEPNQLYEVTVEYAFASRMFAGPFFYIITGALTKHPSSAPDLYPAFKDMTWNGSDENVGFTWQDKKYDFTVRSDEQGTLYVVIGVWGTWEVGHIYYFDNVRVTLTKKPAGSEFYSFEGDIQGWSSNASDLGSGSGSIERVQQYALDGEDGKYSINFDLNSLNENGKLWIERPFIVERGRKYKVALDYAFHSYDCGDTPRFKIISGVFRRHSVTGEDVIDAVQEKTTSTGCTWGWMHKSYDFTIKAKKTDALYVVIGIWGTEQARRTYNIDSVCVTVTPK